MDAFGIAWRLGATLFFVALNGFFVAAEFALVKVRAGRIDSLAGEGRRSARSVSHILGHLDLYLSACQLGITLASLVLGALGEPAVSVLILEALRGLDVQVDPNAPWLPIVSIGLAFLVITVLHMTIGEQAPKMWALRRAESTALKTAPILRAFTFVFRPFIIAINAISNWLLRLIGVDADGGHEAAHTAEEIRSILSLSAEMGHISDREHEITENVFQMMGLEVRHIMVPRVEVEFLTLSVSLETNFERVHTSSHSRFPLCEEGLDTIIGFVHAKDVYRCSQVEGSVDFASIAREPVIVPDTMALPDLLRQLQGNNQRCAAVIDEHGTVVGLTFLEDILEEIVGVLGDEFDDEEEDFVELSEGVFEVSGRVALPEVQNLLQFDLGLDDEGEDTIGGLVTARLGRLPRKGDSIRVGQYDATVVEMTRRRVHKLRMQSVPEPQPE